MFADKISINGKFSEYIKFITDRQLLDTALWQHCIDVFSSGIDNADAGWRGEYWGKMMRGACLVYSVTESEELYSVLTDAVKGLLSKQEPDGRISSYRRGEEFFGWDMWSRKYVMTGLQHYYDICRDESFKKLILEALTRHADCIIENIGEGKTEILNTGSHWGGVNSASILEPFVRLYKDTEEKRYLDFAEYIIKTGGCRDGNLIDCALSGKAPFEFSEQKAYETMSFFEGLLAYYEITGNEYYLDAVKKFTYAALKTDVTAIGSCGCTHELFDNSALRQTEPSEKIMQETCVTVTLMRLLTRLFAVTHDKKLIDTLRLSALNALSGALNINGFEQFSNEKKQFLPGMVFDSYSPLCDGARARGIGGFKVFADGTYFGCCACIASAGFALYPLNAVVRFGNEIIVNYITDGEYSFGIDGKAVTLEFSGGTLSVNAESGAEFILKISAGDEYTAINPELDGACAECKDGYYVFEGKTVTGRQISLNIQNRIVEKTVNGKQSFNYGGFCLAADTAKTGTYAPGRKIRFARDETGNAVLKMLTPLNGEQLRFCADTDRGALILTDYAAAGQNGKSLVTVWF